MNVQKSPIIYSATQLMLWYAERRWKHQPSAMPVSFPCVALLCQSGASPDGPISQSSAFAHSDEGIGYIYPDDFGTPIQEQAKRVRAKLKKTTGKKKAAPKRRRA